MKLGAVTDSEGLASAYWTLGGDAGCGNNRVKATCAGLAGEALFCASAGPGSAAQINIGTGNNQRGEAGAPVRSAPGLGERWLQQYRGVPVTFRVGEAQARSTDGQRHCGDEPDRPRSD
jgi:hypothetical protein